MVEVGRDEWPGSRGHRRRSAASARRSPRSSPRGAPPSRSPTSTRRSPRGTAQRLRARAAPARPLTSPTSLTPHQVAALFDTVARGARPPGRARQQRRHRRCRAGGRAELRAVVAHAGGQPHRHVPLRPGAARHMLPAGHGVIVNIGSVFAATGMPMRAAYAASKHAVVGLTKVLATEWAGRGMRVVAIDPAYVRTALDDADQRAGDYTAADIERRTPMGRYAEPAESRAPSPSSRPTPRRSSPAARSRSTAAGWPMGAGRHRHAPVAVVARPRSRLPRTSDPALRSSDAPQRLTAETAPPRRFDGHRRSASACRRSHARATRRRAVRRCRARVNSASARSRSAPAGECPSSGLGGSSSEPQLTPGRAAR